MGPTDVLSRIALPVLGIMILAFCLLSFFFPYGERFKEKTQKIKGFGIDLEISLLTLLVIVGMVLCATGIYPQIAGYEGRIASANEEARKAKAETDVVREALERSRIMRIQPLVTLEGVDATGMPNLMDLKCKYFLPRGDTPREAVVSPGYASNQLKVTLEDVSADTVIRSLILVDLASQRRWWIENIAPLEPLYQLKRVE